MKRNLPYIQHIHERIIRIETFLSGIELDEFRVSLVLQDAVVRNLEVIGEASRNFSTEFREKYSHMPWRTIIGLRNVLIHDYINVDIDELWRIYRDDFPGLKAEIEAILLDLNNDIDAE